MSQAIVFFRFIKRISKLKLFYKQNSIPANKNLENIVTGLVNEKLRRNCRILVAPLDWGLGHATRCIPIISELVERRCDVWLAGAGMPKSLLRSEFPDLPFLPLNGYNIRYSASREIFALKILSQVPRIIFEINREHRWLNKMVRSHGFDAVISDNRFGLFHRSIPSIFVSHQLHIKTSLGPRAERILEKWNYGYINRFSECWVPDLEGETNLAGELSHPVYQPAIPVRYLGVLSRLKKTGSAEVRDHVLFILSGPEPQRTILENKVVDEVSHYPGTASVVRGLPSSSSVIPSTGMIRFYNHLTSEELNEEMSKAEWVISRSGYSTIMDIFKLRKKSILIATPGQSEQEYLAERLHKNGIAFTIDQNDFSLAGALERARRFNYRMLEVPDSELKLVVGDFLRGLASGNS